MSHDEKYDAAPVRSAFLERCCKLRLAAWWINEYDQVVCHPVFSAEFEKLFDQESFHSHIRAALDQPVMRNATGISQALPGCWLLPVQMPPCGAASVDESAPGRSVVVMILAPEASRSPWFLRLADDAKVNQAEAARMLAPIATATPSDSARVNDMLDMMAADVADQLGSTRVISRFTEELAQTYETLDLLYTLGRAARDPENPERLIAFSLEQLSDTLPFNWAVGIFSDSADLTGKVSDACLIANDTLQRDCKFEKAIRKLIGRPEDHQNQRVLHADSDWPDAFGAQIALEPIQRGATTIGVLVLGGKPAEDAQITSYDLQTIQAAAAHVGAFIELSLRYEMEQQAFLGTLHALTAAIDAKDAYTCGHSDRVAHLSALLGTRLKLPDENVHNLNIAGIVHDVGKIGVPERILTKRARLTAEEFDQIKAHPEIGYNILRDIPALRPVLPAVMHHHERWDGRGYPHNLVGTDIPLDARIMALADTFDAMSSTRSYRPAMPREHVLQEIERCAGSQFDPDLVGPFLSIDFAGYDHMVHEAQAAGTTDQASKAA